MALSPNYGDSLLYVSQQLRLPHGVPRNRPRHAKGKLDILVNNAGLFLGKDIEAASLAERERLCAVNLTGVSLGTKLCLPALREAAQQSPQGAPSSTSPRPPASSVPRKTRSTRWAG
ncbi:MAG: SDR family NAD(P)-dependent oxidoreductase [Stellaceae bacterium]